MNKKWNDRKGEILKKKERGKKKILGYVICDIHTHALNCLYNTCCRGKQRFLKIKNKTLFLGAEAIVLYFMHFKALAPFNMYFFLFYFFIAHSNSLQPCTIKEYQIAFLCAFFSLSQLRFRRPILSSPFSFFSYIFLNFSSHSFSIIIQWTF